MSQTNCLLLLIRPCVVLTSKVLVRWFWRIPLGLFVIYPHQLVKAFRATLEETLEADLLLHVVDTVSEDRDIQINAVNEVLAEIGNKTPVLMVYNKIDCLESHEPRIVLNDEGTPAEVWLSARDGMGIAELKAALAQILVGDIRTYHLQLQPQYAKLRAQLFALNAVKAEVIQEDGVIRLDGAPIRR
jgi:GTP-binding protein HflX